MVTWQARHNILIFQLKKAQVLEPKWFVAELEFNPGRSDSGARPHPRAQILRRQQRGAAGQRPEGELSVRAGPSAELTGLAKASVRA